MTLQEQLKQARKDKKITTYQMLKMGVDYHSIETGNPTLSSVYKYLDAIGMELDNKLPLNIKDK